MTLNPFCLDERNILVLGEGLAESSLGAILALPEVQGNVRGELGQDKPAWRRDSPSTWVEGTPSDQLPVACGFPSLALVLV